MRDFFDYMRENPGERPNRSAEAARVRLINAADVTEDQRRAAEICKEYERLQNEAAMTQAAILDGIKDLRQPADLLLQACKEISLLTGNKSFYDKALEAMAGNYADVKWEQDQAPAAIRLRRLQAEKARIKPRYRAIVQTMQTLDNAIAELSAEAEI